MSAEVSSTLTLAALAREKRLPEEFLKSLGVHDTLNGVAIPYYDQNVEQLFERLRLSLDGAVRFRQPLGISLQPYGLNRLEAERKTGKPLILVEGESDCWTLWFCGVAALGLPGACTARTIQPEHVQDFTQIIVIQEPGSGGERFATGIARRLQEIGFDGESFVISLGAYKDPSDLYCEDPERFLERFEDAVNHATVLAIEDIGEQAAGFQTLAEYLASTKMQGAKKNYWQGILREGEVSILAGRAMAGKSTFACALTHALSLGEPLLGRECVSAKVGYMALERNGSDVAELLKKWLVDQLQVWFLDEVPPLQDDHLAVFLEEQINRHGLEIVIVDHLQNMVRVTDANDYAKVSRALEPFQKVAKRTDAHLMLLHHQPKTRRESDEIDVMGSEAFRTAADALIEVSRANGSHYIRASVRRSEGLPRMLVNIDLESGEVQALDAEKADAENALSKIREYLQSQNEPLKSDVIREEVGLKNAVVSAALKMGSRSEEGCLIRTGGGTRGDPYLYQTREFYSHAGNGMAGRESSNTQKVQLAEAVIQFPDRWERNSSGASQDRTRKPYKEWID